MPGETISTAKQLDLPDGVIATILGSDLIYINGNKSVNGYENDKFVCRLLRKEMHPAFLEFCMEDHDYEQNPVYAQFSAVPTERHRVKGVIFPDDPHWKDEWVYIWIDPTPISIVPFDKLVRHSVEGFEPAGQDMILLEEMLELGLELLHNRRDRGNRAHIVEELSHVMISSQVLKQVLHVTDEEINNEAMKKLHKYGWDHMVV